MNIRTATTDDAALLAQMNLTVHQLYAEAQPHLYKPMRADDPELLAFYRDTLADPDVAAYIVAVDGVPAGYIVLRLLSRPESVFTHAMSVLYIDQISVDPQYRRRGCGEALMRAGFELAQARGVQRVVLDVGSFNEEAQRFFERQGFRFFNYRMDAYLNA